MLVKNIFKNSFYYTIAGLLPQLVNFSLMPVYTRYMSPEDFAVLALITVFNSLLAIIITFQINSGISRIVISFLSDEERAKKCFSGSIILISSLLVLGGIILEFWGDSILSICFSNQSFRYKPFFQIGAWTIILNTIQNACQVLVRIQEKAREFVKISLFVTVSGTASSIIMVVAYRMGVAGVLYGGLISAAIGLILYSILVKDWFRWAFPRKDIIEVVKFSIPLIPHAMAGYVFMYSDRLILEHYVPLSAIGIYAVADKFATMMKLLLNSFNDAYSPHFMKKAEIDPNKAREETKAVINLWWVFVLWALLGFYLFSEEIVKIMTEEKFFQASTLIPFMATAYIFRGLYCFSVNGIFLMRKSWAVPLITIAAGVVSITTNLLCVPRYGINGSVIATIAAFFATFVFSYVLGLFIFKIYYPWKRMLISILIFVLLLSIRFVFVGLKLNSIEEFAVDVVFFLAYGLYAVMGSGAIEKRKKYVRAEL